MHIIVLANEGMREEFTSKILSGDITATFVESVSDIHDSGFADAFFLLREEVNRIDNRIFNSKPVFINSTINTLHELDLPGNFNRINGWPGFLNREVWEVATSKEDTVKEIFEKLKWKYIAVADEPGLVSARIISMIINEAYFALGENVSTKDEIDIAMKLGTNYPYGPFEWSKKIGLKRIYNLLKKLSETDSRYAIATAMEKDINS